MGLGDRRPKSENRVEVLWVPSAKSNLIEIISYIAQFDETAAYRIGTRLRDATEILAEHPRIGRSVGRGIRQLSTVYPYLIRYRVRRDLIEIISVRHGARR